MRPGFYPDAPSKVELKQTHMSYVFLAGEHVYKVKKAVHFDFADCSTIRVRYELCCEEVRLNRRLARDFYIGVVPIFRDRRRFILGDESESFDPGAAEYAVKMRRFPERRMLDRLVRNGEAGVAEIDALAKRLADFHRGVSSAGGRLYGSAMSIYRLTLGNLDECARFIGSTLTDSQFKAINDYLKDFILAHYEALNDRVRQAYVRDGHGDLRCEHICMTPDIQIFDCVEFSERLRCGDVAAEIAFLAMDLDSLSASRLSDGLVEAYAKETGDNVFPTLINFYKCHRACVRGKVESLTSLDDKVPPAEREKAREQAKARFSLAARYASRARPVLVIVCGLSGTGKSTMSHLIQYRTGFEMLNSDRIRKSIAGVPETTHASAPYGSDIYNPAFDRLTYETLLARARACLRDGRGVIIDATFKRPEDRNAALEAGRQFGIPVLFVECQASEQEVMRRLRDRTQKGTDPSDATEEVYRHQRAEFVQISEIPSRRRVVVDTGAGTERALASIEQFLCQAYELG